MASRVGGAGLPRRRNGKEQACEPCRKAKIACDHALPVCSRCKRRKVAQKCVYLSAPMTRPADPSRRQSEPNINIFPLTPTTGTSVVSPSLTAPLYPRASTSKPSIEPAPPLTKAGGFFGPTSFSAVFAENRENLGGNDDIAIINDREPYIPSNESLQAQMYLMLAGKKELGLGEPRTVLGARVLRTLPDQNTCNFLLEWYFEKCNDSRSYKRTAMATATSLWSTYGQALQEPRRAEDLERMSSLICKNAEIALEESHDFDVWIASVTGPNLRWESVGSIFSALTSAILSLQERDAFFTTQRGSRTDRKHFAVEMKDCLQACITLSNYMDLLNILMVALLCRNLILQTVISGDTSLVCWRQLGDLVSATTALGLHRQVDQRITFLTEFKKFLFAIVFGIDKSASLLTGRPPALSYRYTKFELPLDLCDDVVIKGGEELTRAIEQLDPNGWNTNGVVHIATKVRAHGYLAIVLNEILELSLSDSTDDEGGQILYLLDRLDKTYTSFPAYIRLDINDPSNATVPDHVFWTRLCTRLHVLEHRLILERLSHKHSIGDGQAMIDCAREMLELTVLLWVQRDRFVERHCDYDWMLMCWGVPSSGVLCVELLKQMKQPPGTPNTLKLPRSEIVQNLSLLIGFLEWVRPAAGNYQLCRRMSLLVKRILDQILNPSPSSSNPIVSQISIQPDGQQGFDTTNTSGLALFDAAFDMGNWEDGLDNLDWLNTFDWSRGPWRHELGGAGMQDFSAAARWN